MNQRTVQPPDSVTLPPALAPMVLSPGAGSLSAGLVPTVLSFEVVT